MGITGTKEAVESGAEGVMLTTPIHREIRKRIRVAAIQEGVSMAEWLHRHFCGEFDRLDLIHRVPRSKSAPSD